jgi:mono/diheme cytochrome c family protein
MYVTVLAVLVLTIAAVTQMMLMNAHCVGCHQGGAVDPGIAFPAS